MKHSLFKKIAFFWFVIHLAAYLSFKLQWTPSFKHTEGKATIINYVLTPKYTDETYTINDYSKGIITTKKNMMFLDCKKCTYTESDNFYPFHKFTYWWGGSYSPVKGFVGIFGYYGNDEFIVYFIIPLTLWILTLLYRKLFINK